MLEKEFPEISFRFCTSEEELLRALPDAELLIGTHVRDYMLDVAPNLKFIQSFFAGMDHYNLKRMEQSGIVVANARGLAVSNFSEWVIGAMIMMARSFNLIAKNNARKVWFKPEQGEIAGRTLGILGLGAIGREVAKKASLLGMHVIAVKRTPGEQSEGVSELFMQAQMDEVLERSDFVVNLLPHTPETHELIDRRSFARMKPTASFINPGRGKTVKEADMIEALQNKTIKNCMLDVYYNEPLQEDSPLWDMENVFITPHVAGENVDYVEKGLPIIRHNLACYLSGNYGDMMNIVSSERGY